MSYGEVIGNAFFGIFLIGIAIGVALCGLAWGAWLLLRHLDISWIS